ncbi:MAG: C25 family peptidase C-terminal domain-containing protein, partial [Candidatus Marinimicrobia bacterium]|nr:C25 family peptidase C-terminal domain-containing protein [Candidatus Neomarinimicrobiota bacterium]
FSGSALMIDEYGSSGFAMYATWHIFGDPSMPLRTQTPQPFTNVSVSDILILGTSQLSINTTGISNAIISLSKNGELLDAAAISGFGTTVLNFEPLTEIDTCILTITGQNRIPWQQELLIIAPEDPYLVTQGFTITDDVFGNGNGLVDFGEVVDLNLIIQNVGADTCDLVNAQISLDDPYISLVNDFFSSTILPGDSVVALGPYELIIAENVPNGHPVHIAVFMDNGMDTWESEIIINIQAPAVTFANVTVLDDGNGRLDIGESAVLKLSLNNLGGSGLASANVTLASSDPYVAALGPMITLGNFEAGTLDSCSFDIELEYATPPGYEIEFSWILESDQGYAATGAFSMLAGLIVEDFESSDFTAFDWLFSGHQDWVIDNSDFLEGQFSARSGVINNNQNSELSLIIEADEEAVLSFNYKVSSQAGSDGLLFLIDGILQNTWQGEIPWSEAVYPLTTGEHELTWKYTKNSSGASGSDCAWIDFIILPLSEVPGTIIGDVTADAQINVQDIVRLVNIILGQGAEVQPYELYCGNMNGDTIIDIGDLVLLVNIIMGQ